ncbi:hypothetical protein Syun_006004 [Stephania yunnanensis]|uniref:Uncharacterized protein n=1 Tax=Stephania yunnanensis TaxID=152371 RepID=A0AAP0KX92_9MAGN
MPSAHDQLSKLTGTALICICMGFMMPSLGINRGSENWSNVLALSILVVTVVGNICIQLHTGVIILFRAEHIIMLCCMMLLLLAYFAATFEINSQRGFSVDPNKDLFKKGEGSMLERLKLCYLFAYHCNPQLVLCKDVDSVPISVLCIVSPVVLFQAVICYRLNCYRLRGSIGKRVMVTVYLRYELLSERRRYLSIECTLGALIQVCRYLIVAWVRAGRRGSRPKLESAGLLP